MNGATQKAKAVWSNQALVGVLLLIAVACYANTLANGFVYDDEQQILQNPYVKSWHYLPQIFGSTVWSFVGAAGATNYYRPLMTFSYLVLWSIFGELPFGFHLFNLLVNTAVVVAVFYAGRSLFQDQRIAWVAAVLFAVHPVHTETVNWIAGLPDLEATFFFVLTFLLYGQPGKSDWKRQCLIVASFALAMLSKEPALMLAPLILAFEHFVRSGHETTPFSSKAARYAPLCLLAPAYLLLRIALFGKLAPVLQHPKITWPEAIYSAFAMITGYTKYLIWPSPLSAFHVFHPSSSLAEWRVLAGIGVVALCLALIFALSKKAPQAAFCVLWIGVTLAPVLNARWMAANVFTERYLYLPSVGFCWLFAWCGIQVWDAGAAWAPRLRPVLVAALIAACLLAGIKTMNRNLVWRNDLTLYTRTLETNPDAAIIRSNLAGVYYDSGDYQRAGREWEVALAGKPDNVITMNALGMLYTQQGRYSEAEVMLRRAIDTRPLWGTPHYTYGVLLQKTGDMQRALAEFKAAVELSPLNAAARRWYGEALLATGQIDEAQVELKRAVELEPSLTAQHDLADVYLRRGKNEEAQVLLRRMVAAFPYDSAAHFQLAKLCEAAGHTAEAIHEYQAGLLMDATNAEAKASLQRLEKQSH